MTEAPLLEVHDLAVTISGRAILHDVNFRIERGEFTGLIGSNGAGKTTLLRVLLGLQAPAQGDVLIHGQPLNRRNRSIGYVPQKVIFDTDIPIRVRDFVTLGLDGDRYGLARRTKATYELVAATLDAVGATQFSERRIGTLSGGEQQRVMIAHALVSQPKLLLLDEPLANLDPGSVQDIVELLHSVSMNRGVAILISAHEMNSLLPVMDRVVYAANGQVASGTTDEVIRPEILSSLYGHHVDVIRIHGRIMIVASEGSIEREIIPSHPTFVVE